MTRFRPCIDLHEGKVKQIVGGTFGDGGDGPSENFVSEHGAAHFAARYRDDGLAGGHVIMLGPGNEAEARAALEAYPGGLQVGGGIDEGSAPGWIEAGASHVIVTSWLFSRDGQFLGERLDGLGRRVGVGRLVADLSCRARPGGGGWDVAMDRWQRRTALPVTPETLDLFAGRCAELLVHAADVEGRCAGIDRALVEMLGRWGKLPVTYAGGARSADDLRLVDGLSGGSVDLTIGSALDLFGGTGARYSDCVAWNRGRSGEAGRAAEAGAGGF